ncbi:MAG: PaaI family thioesterase [Bacteroidaceae bacterium]|nr:PaaI family thioesterase [Bacteroidaceae bacterium]
MKKIKNPWIDLTDKGYNCFACAPSNPCGLKMEFYEDGDDIVSLWTPGDNYQGWLDTLHGGIQATLMDEIGGWIIARKFQTSGMTTNLNIKYKKPIPTGKDVTIEIRGRVKEVKRMFVFIEAEIRYDGEVRSSAEMTYYTFSKDIAEKDFMFTGCELEE